MGYENLSFDARNTLREIARMAYGSGLFEGVSGGKGRMGVLFDPSGKARVVKFNTNSYERSFGQSVSKNREMLTSSDNLRLMLKSIADSAGLKPDVLREIYAKLGLTQDGKLAERTAPTSKDLLSRKIVAAVVSKIGGDQVWNDAWKGIDKQTYSSGWKTQLKDIQTAGPQHPNAKSVTRVQTFTAKDIREILPDVKAEIDKLPDSPHRKFVSDRLGSIFNEKLIDELVGHEDLRGVSRQAAVKYLAGRLDVGIAALKDEPGVNLNDSEGMTRVVAALRKAVKGQTENGGAEGVGHPLLTRSNFTVRVKDLHGIGITTKDLDDAFAVLKGKFGLSGQQVQTVSKMTMAYLASKLGDAASQATLPGASKLLGQIKEGKFFGTFVGLLNCNVLDPHENNVPEGNILLPKESCPRIFFARRDAQTCENLVFLLGKCRTDKKAETIRDRNVLVNGKTEKVDCEYHGLDTHLLDAMAEKQSELIGKFNDTGKLSMDDIYRSVLGREPTLKPGEDLFQELVVRNVLARTVRVFGLQPRQMPFEIFCLTGLYSYESGIFEFGCSFEDLCKLRGGSKASVKLEINQTYIDSRSHDYSCSKAECITQIAIDNPRAAGDFYIKFGDKTIRVEKSIRNEDSKTKAEEIFNAAFEFVHGKDSNVPKGDPMSHQLRQALILCHQGGLLPGYSIMGSRDARADREFYFDQGGALHCVIKQTLRADNEKNAPLRNCSYHFVINKDGTNKLLDFTAEKIP